MKKILAALCIVSALALTVHAEESKDTKGHHAALTDQQQEVKDYILHKYDENEDGKIDRKEFAEISGADRRKMVEVGLLKEEQ